jgi:hypothetical protein
VVIPFPRSTEARTLKQRLNGLLPEKKIGNFAGTKADWTHQVFTEL